MKREDDGVHEGGGCMPVTCCVRVFLRALRCPASVRLASLACLASMRSACLCCCVALPL